MGSGARALGAGHCTRVCRRRRVARGWCIERARGTAVISRQSRHSAGCSSHRARAAVGLLRAYGATGRRVRSNHEKVYGSVFINTHPPTTMADITLPVITCPHDIQLITAETQPEEWRMCRLYVRTLGAPCVSTIGRLRTYPPPASLVVLICPVGRAAPTTDCTRSPLGRHFTNRLSQGVSIKLHSFCTVLRWWQPSIIDVAVFRLVILYTISDTSI